MSSTTELFWASDVAERAVPETPVSPDEPDSASPSGTERAAPDSPWATLNKAATLFVAFGLATAFGVWLFLPGSQAKPESAPGKSIFRLANPVNFVLWMSGAETDLDDMQKTIDENLKSMQTDLDLQIHQQPAIVIQQIYLQKLVGPQFHLPINNSQQARPNGASPFSANRDADEKGEAWGQANVRH